MAKKLINLVIEAQPEPPALRKLRRITPLVTMSLLATFIIFQILSLVYVQINVRKYNKLKDQVDSLEKKISSEKSLESLYITTIGILDKIKNILFKDTKIISNTIPALFNMQDEDTVIMTSVIDNNGPLGFFVKTTSLESMEKFVEKLRKSETENNFKEIKAAGILRENDGSYTFSINLKAGKKN